MYDRQCTLQQLFMLLSLAAVMASVIGDAIRQMIQATSG
jgi:hypothetical protein